MESELGRKIQVALVKAGARIWRNSIALAWAGNNVKRFSAPQCITIQVMPGDVLIRNARPIHAGLCENSADYVGLYHGKFTACEVKTPTGHVKPGQQDFIDMVNREGGIGFIARSVDEAVEKLCSRNKSINI